MSYLEENDPSMNTGKTVSQLYAELSEMTRQSYEHLAEADRNRRLASAEWRIAKLEHLFNQREQQRAAAANNSTDL
jgi:hypothetical protein